MPATNVTLAPAGYLSTQQAAARLHLSASRVRHLIRDGRLPSELFGRDRFIREADLALVRCRPKAGRPKVQK